MDPLTPPATKYSYVVCLSGTVRFLAMAEPCIVTRQRFAADWTVMGFFTLYEKKFAKKICIFVEFDVVLCYNNHAFEHHLTMKHLAGYTSFCGAFSLHLSTYRILVLYMMIHGNTIEQLYIGVVKVSEQGMVRSREQKQ